LRISDAAILPYAVQKLPPRQPSRQRPTDGKPGAWWQVDLEQPHTIASVQTIFVTAGNYRYRIEGSPDGNAWTLLVDQTKTQGAEKVRTDAIPADRHRQFVRITFTALPEGQRAAISNVRIEGQHWP
jgi:hypothetical protein